MIIYDYVTNNAVVKITVASESQAWVGGLRDAWCLFWDKPLSSRCMGGELATSAQLGVLQEPPDFASGDLVLWGAFIVGVASGLALVGLGWLCLYTTGPRASTRAPPPNPIRFSVQMSSRSTTATSLVAKAFRIVDLSKAQALPQVPTTDRGIITAVGALTDRAVVPLKTAAGTSGLVACVPCADKEAIVDELAALTGAVCGAHPRALKVCGAGFQARVLARAVMTLGTYMEIEGILVPASCQDFEDAIRGTGQRTSTRFEPFPSLGKAVQDPVPRLDSTFWRCS